MEGVKYELFRVNYEEVKLHLQYNNNPKSLDINIRGFEE